MKRSQKKERKQINEKESNERIKKEERGRIKKSIICEMGWKGKSKKQKKKITGDDNEH